MDKTFENILVISDSHFPYNHPDTYEFYKAVNKQYGKFDKVVHIGDEIDNHAISYHDSDPNLYGAGDELEAAIECLKPFYDMFPRVDVINSNHGSLAKRKAKSGGMPNRMVKDYGDVIDAPKGWVWHNDLTLKIPYNLCYFHHGKSSSPMKLSKNMAMCAVQGHFHSKFDIQYWGNPVGLFWQMTVGCTIDDKSVAYEYNKTTLDRPIIGCGVIVNGQPMLIPMLLGKDGRWIGRLL
jgi:hypothetical protein